MKKLIFVHGGPGFPDYLRGFFEGQFQAGMSTIFYDQVSQTEVNLSDLVTQLSEIVKASSQDVCLIGHSWGGVLALEYLRREPSEKIQGLVLIDSYLCTDHINLEFQEELKTLGLKDSSWDEIFLSERELKDGTKLIRDLKEKYKPHVMKNLDGYLDSFNLQDYFRSLKLPILNIFGRFDIRVPARIIKTFPKINPRVKNAEIPGAGHFPFILQRNRDLIVKEIQKFISN